MTFRTARSKFNTLEAGKLRTTAKRNYTRKKKKKIPNMVDRVMKTRTPYEKELVQSHIEYTVQKYGDDAQEKMERMVRFLDKHGWTLGNVLLEVDKRQRCGREYALPMPSLKFHTTTNKRR